MALSRGLTLLLCLAGCGRLAFEPDTAQTCDVLPADCGEVCAPFAVSALPPQPDPTASSCAVTFGDFDGDGDDDLALGHCPAELPNPTGLVINLHRNDDGVLSFWDQSAIEGGVVLQLAAADVDGFGRELLAVATPQRVVVLEMTPEGLRRRWQPPTTAPRTAVDLAFADFDADGRQDLVVAYGGPRPENFEVYRSGDAGSFEIMWQSPMLRPHRGIAAGDCDGDGFVDIVVTGAIDRRQDGARDFDSFIDVWVSEPGARPGVREFRLDEGILRPETISSLALGDVDGDGQLDLALGNLVGADAVLRGRDGIFAPHWSAEVARTTRMLRWVDVDSDGDPDLFAGSAEALPELDGQLLDTFDRLYLNEGGTLREAWASPFDESTFAADFGDLDGDCRPDLATASGGRSPQGQYFDRVFRNRLGERVQSR